MSLSVGTQRHYTYSIFWVISLLLLVASAIDFQLAQASSQVTSNNRDAATGNRNNKPLQGAASVDDILNDTMQLLDALDQKLINVQNKTPNALMRDNLRALDSTLLLVSESDGPHKTDEMRAPIRGINETINLEPAAHITLTNGAGNKQARQLMEENQFASDSTERHIKFTLDLMQAVFASHSSSSSSSSSQQQAPSSSSSSSSSASASPQAAAKATTNSIDSFLISPLSIQMVLMMVHLGARGQTRRELGNSLHLPAEKQPAPLSSSSSSFPTTSESAVVDSTSKLKRRTNQEGNKPPTQQQQHQQQRQQQQQQQAQLQRAQQAGMAHEMFGSAMRNLLKDTSVLKALTSANQLFLQKNLPLAQQFEWAIKHYYGADIKLVDFKHQSSPVNNNSLPSSIDNNNTSTNSSSNGADSSRQDVQQIINDWIERQSRGKISNFLSSPVPASTLMMAINVIYFKGDWQYKFDPADTETDAWFTQVDGKQVKLPMMVNRLPLAFAHDAAMRTSVIELPYKAQRLGLFLLLPDEVSGIFHTMQMLNSTSFAHLISSMRKPSHQQQQSPLLANAKQQSAVPINGANNAINIRIPKFSIESSPRLSQILSQQLGLKTLFTPDMADLTGMFAQQGKRTSNNRTRDDQHPPPQVGLDELIHKAVLQVDEQGSVAAATSATIVERVGAFNGNYFEADHPFLIFLMDKQTGLVLFSGVFAGNNNQNNNSQQQDAVPSACKRTGYNLQQQQQQQCT